MGFSHNTSDPSTKSAPRRKERGVAILEFGLVAIPMVFMMIWLVVIGLALGRSIQVAQFARDADAMFMRGAPLYSGPAQNFLVQLGQGINFQTSGGDGLITLSKIQFIPDPVVCGTPVAPQYPNCTTGKNVLVQRIIIGNTSIAGSGTRYPTAGTVSYDSFDQVNNSTTDPNAVITNFASSLQLKPLETSFVSEAYFQSNMYTLSIISSAPGFYTQAFF
jgi:Flp pilus assembly protein TadG